jgi:hypothetical protein
MATILTKYAHTNRRFKKSWNWDSDTFHLRLLNSTYTFSDTHTVWADASSAEIAATGNYTANGKTLTCSSDNTKLMASDVIWTNLTHTFYQGVIVRTGTVDGLTDALVGHYLWNDAGGGTNIVLDDIDFLVRMANGVFTL